MVLRGSTTTCISSSSSAPLAKLLTQARKISTSKSSSTQPPRLGVIKQSVRDRNFAFANVAVFVSKSRRTPTQKTYDAKWIVYTRWCHRRKVNPVSAPLSITADFLFYLFLWVKLQMNTSKGYRYMISSTFNLRLVIESDLTLSCQN